MKTTLYGRQPQQWNILTNTDCIFLVFETVAKGTKLTLENDLMKTTTNKRRPQNSKSEISQQSMNGCS
jgi:hypothetical protein